MAAATGQGLPAEAGTHGVVNVQAFIDGHPVSPLQRLLLFLCFIVIAIDGFDTAIAADVLPGFG